MAKKQAIPPTKIASPIELMLESLCYEVRALTLATRGQTDKPATRKKLHELIVQCHTEADRIRAASYGQKVPS